MDWLAGLPLVGPVVRWVMRTRVYRVWEHYSDRHGNHLAGAVTYFGFLSLFPIIAVSGAAGAAVLTPHQLHAVQDRLAEQIPGIADQLDLERLASNAATISLIGLLVLLYSGLAGVAVARGSIRAVWSLPEDPGNPFLRKVLDLGVLVGLLLAFTVTVGGSVLATALAGHAANWLGVAHSGAGRAGLAALGYLVAVAAGFVLFGYLLTWLPMLKPPRRSVVGGALIGAVGFEVLKLLLSGYLTKVADKGVYGAFGVPVALLLWINFASRLLLFCAAWTAEGASRERADRLRREEREDSESEDSGEGGDA